MGWEESLTSWAKPPGQTEQARCDNAVTAIRKAVAASPKLINKQIRVSAQGSYCNRTNVRQDSDVDVCILCSDSLFYDLPPGLSTEDVLITTPATYSFPEYRNDVQAALVSYFGSGGVTRGNKAFDIHQNTYRVDADAVAAFLYRRYDKDKDFVAGTAFVPDNGTRIINWPDQNYDNGIQKNNLTGGRFKDVVRIVKTLRNKMAEEAIAAAKPIPSFLIECLVWNVPDGSFGHDTYTFDVRESLAHLFNKTMKFEDCKEWGEVNELKYLFRTVQPWTMEQAHSFVDAAWNYLGLE